MNNNSKLLQSLPPSIFAGLKRLAEAEGTSMDLLLVVSIAEKLARSEHAAWLAKRFSNGRAVALRQATGSPATLGGAWYGESLGATVDDLAHEPSIHVTRRLSQTETGGGGAELADLFEEAPVLFAVLSGPDHVFEVANRSYRALLGERRMVGRRVVDCMPEVVGTEWMDLLDHVYRRGEPLVERGAVLSLACEEGQPLKDTYVDYTFRPRREADGTVSGIIALGCGCNARS